MSRLRLIKDSLYNASSFVLDETGTQTSANYRVCHNLNQSSGYVNFKSGGLREFYCIPDQNNTVPEQVYTKVSFLSGFQYDFDFDLKINNVSLYSTTFNTSGPYELVDGEYQVSQSGYFTPSFSQLNALVTNKDLTKTKIRHDIVKVTVNPSDVTPALDNKLRQLEINFSGSVYSSYNSLTPEIYSFYPSLVEGAVNNSGVNNSDASFVAGPTNTSGADGTWIYNPVNNSISESGYLYNNSYIDFYFNTSGIFNQNNNTRTIDKCIFSIRANNSSGNISNNQDWCSLGLFLDEFSNCVGFGSGFHVQNQGGFTRLASDLSFSRSGLPNSYLSTSDLMDNFFVRLYQPPRDTKISSAQIDLYCSNDDMLCFNIQAHVNNRVNNLNPKASFSINSGRNRIKQSGYDNEFFNIAYKPLNSGDSVPISYYPSVWSNYYNEEIDSYQYHNKAYKNYLYLEQDNNIVESIDTLNDYTVMLHCSTSGNYNYLKSSYGATLLEKYTGTTLDFKLSVEDEQLNFIARNNFGSYNYANIDSYPNSMIIITGQRLGPLNKVDVYISTGDIDFYNAYSSSSVAPGGVGNLYIGGSGLTDFKGYIHEYGISDSYSEAADINNLYVSRFNLSEVLASGNHIQLESKNINKVINDSFFVNLETMAEKESLYENRPSIFAYNTLLTGPENYLVNINYELVSNNPSGLNLSGYYNEGFLTNGVGFYFDNTLNFQTHLANGSGLLEVQPFTYAANRNRPQTDFNYPTYINFNLNSYNNSNHDYNLVIKDVFLSFNGWYINQTGVQPISFVTEGYTYQDDSLDFYLHNAVSSSGVDFYLKGQDASNNYVNFYTNGSIIQQSGITFNTIGGQVSFDDLDLYSSGPVLNISNINLFIEGTTPEETSESFNISLQSLFSEIGWDNIYYDEYGYPYYYGDSAYGVFSSVGFSINSEFNPEGSINLYIDASTEETEDSINLFVEGNITTDGHFNMFMPNIQSNARYQLDFFLPSAYSQSGNINMFIEGS